MSVEETYKVIVLGDVSVGKTCIVQYLISERFSKEYQTTIGVNFQEKKIERDGKHIQLNIWDTAGQEKFKALTEMYFRGTDVALIVYDITNKVSFDNANVWYYELKDKNNYSPMIILLGNKADLESHRQVARQFATSQGMAFFETSTLTGANIKEVENYIINKKPNYENIDKEKLIKACELQIEILHLQRELGNQGANPSAKRAQLIKLHNQLLETTYFNQVKDLSEDALSAKLSDLLYTPEKQRDSFTLDHTSPQGSSKKCKC